MFTGQNPSSPAIPTAILVILSALYAPAVPAAKPIRAFPGAEGFGSTTPGGRAGRIIEVTNLNTGGPGSFNAACRARGRRIVVFRVSGQVLGSVSVTQPFITIAGQTAPGDGICIRKGMLHVGAHNVIVRHLRARPGDHPFGPDGSDRDCISVSAAGDRVHDVVIDHCSASWGIDENCGTWGTPRNVTFQWCITSEALSDSLHPKGPHGMGMILGSNSNTVSVHHCLLAHNSDRNPYINMKRSKKTTIIDFRNNVIYSWDRRPVSTGGGNLRLNYVGNYLKSGKDSRGASLAYWIFPYGHDPKFYFKDNVWPGMVKGKDDDWIAVWDYAKRRPRRASETFRLSKPAAAPHVTTTSSAQAYEDVLKFAGCTRPVRDVVDDRVIAEVRAGTGRFIDSQWDVGGWPTYASTKPPADSDHDAMPDAWEKRHGLNPNDPADGPKDRDGDGYTNVEEFLNQTDPAKPDSGAPVAQAPVQVQAGNDHIRGAAARKLGEERLAKLKTGNATEESREALLKRVRESGKDVADVLGIKFTRIPKGEFMFRKIKVIHSKPYELGTYEVTQAQWETVMGTRPWSGQVGAEDNPNHPVTYVNYLDCQEFIRRLNACGNRKYRLPTLCEWLYAARAGTDSPFGFGKNKNDLPQYAWCSYREPKHLAHKIFRTSPQAVGLLKPNPWGLYDMAGNALEWLHDWRGNWFYSRPPGVTMTDPMGPKKGSVRLLGGGHFRWRVWQVMRYKLGKHKPHYRGVGVGFRLQRAVP